MTIRILADASLPDLDLLFGPPFALTTYQNHKEDTLQLLLPEQEVLLCRSTLKITPNLLQNTKLQCIASATSGIDHLPIDDLKNRNIAVFDAKGSNARAVTDYVMATLAYLSKNNRITGKKAGIIGLGEVGTRVRSRLEKAGFLVVAYDPLKAIEDISTHYNSLSEIARCDLICVHANLHNTQPYPSEHLLSTDFLKQVQPGSTIINAARGKIIDETALLSMTQPITYCTDVYSHEPNINPDIIDFSTLCTPHIAGHTIEAKQAAVLTVSIKLHDHYHIPHPILPKTHLNKSDITISPPITNDSSMWEDILLSLYNPITDTQQLKQSSDKTKSFLTQRTAHQYRHDFSIYKISPSPDPLTKTLLGHE